MNNPFENLEERMAHLAQEHDLTVIIQSYGREGEGRRVTFTRGDGKTSRQVYSQTISLNGARHAKCTADGVRGLLLQALKQIEG